MYNSKSSLIIILLEPFPQLTLNKLACFRIFRKTEIMYYCPSYDVQHWSSFQSHKATPCSDLQRSVTCYNVV